MLITKYINFSLSPVGGGACHHTQAGAPPQPNSILSYFRS